MNLKDETIMMLKKYNVRINKNLGQNFLINENIVDNIIESSNIDKDDLIIEIGPGLGTLTSKLLEKSDKVIVIELDKQMSNIIEDRFKLYRNIKIINDDILKIDLKTLIEKEKNTGKVKIVANLPYYISTSIIMKLIEENLNIDEIIVMVQKEVAQRILAIPGSKQSGSITYAIDYYTQTEKIVDVSNRCFIPNPNVESEVIKLKLRKEPKIEVQNKKLLFSLIKKNFTQRRKTLANILVNFNFVGDKQTAINILNDNGLDENIRGEKLSLEKFEELEKSIDNNKKK